ncbi:MAG: restriction endonuclease subunit S, partial [Candidatus Omnitrophica bacterium]|nr:restriction endonuclease subunit S [Candidatus Omnitrophota bacterium]
MKFNQEKIGNCAVVFNGKTPSKREQRQSGKPILKIKDINENGKFLNDLSSYVDDLFYKKYAKKALNGGDTLILNAAHSSKYVGSKTHFVAESLDDVIPTGEWLVVRPKKDIVNPKYLNICIISSKGKHEIRKIVKGIHLYPKDVEKIKIYLPPLSTQIRIATLLSRPEGLIATRKESISLLDELLKSTFLEMFGDPKNNPNKF